MSVRLQALITTYCASLLRDVQIVERGLMFATRDEDDGRSHLVEALARVHRIKGAGGSLGFAAVSQVAAELETHLRAHGPRDPDAREFTLAFESLDRPKHLPASVRPEASTLFTVDLRQHAPRRMDTVRRA